MQKVYTTYQKCADFLKWFFPNRATENLSFQCDFFKLFDSLPIMNYVYDDKMSAKSNYFSIHV